MTMKFLPAACFTAALCFAAPAVAAPQSITLPAETATLRDSPLPGHQIAVTRCVMCHSVDYVNQQPPGMSVAQWTAEMAKMKNAYGAPITDEEVKSLAEYLASAYAAAPAGPQTGSGAPVSK